MSLLAISDLHVGFRENRQVVERFRPLTADDWLIVAGDVGEIVSDIEWALRILTRRFRTVIWAPGNHELWTHPDDPVQLRGDARYRHLVALCNRLGVVTPEDPYPIWYGRGGPVAVAPLFVLYDYSFRPAGATTKEEGLAVAYETQIVCTDEILLHPDPYPSREAWCHARLAVTEVRLDAVDRDLPTVLCNHFPLRREPTRRLYHQQFAQWCGTERTADWPRRYRAVAVVYGHLHIAASATYAGTRFEEVSLGYPREWRRRGGPARPRRILPAPRRAT